MGSSERPVIWVDSTSTRLLATGGRGRTRRLSPQALALLHAAARASQMRRQGGDAGHTGDGLQMPEQDM